VESAFGSHKGSGAKKADEAKENKVMASGKVTNMGMP